MLNLEYAQLTDIGNRRANQDYMLAHVDEDWAIFVVADGLGAHEGSELAAQYFCHALIELSQDKVDWIMRDALTGMRSLILDSAAIMGKRLVKEHHFDAQTTCAIAWFDQHQFCAAHIGDSRVYRIDKSGLIWRTIDDSLAQQLVDQGIITEDEMASHPAQTMLLRSISVDSILDPHIAVHAPLQSDEIILLCSDGFWETITVDKMTGLINATILEKSLQALVKHAIESASPNSDNVTAQVIRSPL